MRHRIHVPGPIAAGTEVVVTGDEFHHAVRVARVRESEEVELFDGQGGLGSGRVLALGKDQATIAVDRLLPLVPALRGGDWTTTRPLPGGDFAVTGLAALIVWSPAIDRDPARRSVQTRYCSGDDNCPECEAPGARRIDTR